MKIQRAMLAFGIAIVTAVGHASIPQTTAQAALQADQTVTSDEKVLTPVSHPLAHSISLPEALTQSKNFETRVIGFSYRNPAVTGAYFPSSTYTPEQFLKDFQTQHGSQPAVNAFLTAPSTVKDLRSAAAKRIPVEAPEFSPPVPTQGDSKTQSELKKQAASPSLLQSATSTTSNSWYPAEAIVRTYEDDGNAVLKSSYTWDQSRGSLDNFDPNFGLEIEINLVSDGLYGGKRPFCGEGENLIAPDVVKRHFWAQNQNWSSWSVTTIGDQSTNTADIQPYADYNDLSDECNTQSIAVGIGKPGNLPDLDKQIYGFMVQVVAPPGNVAVNGFEQSGIQPVHYDCDYYWGDIAHTDCMGIKEIPYPDAKEPYYIALRPEGAGTSDNPDTRTPLSTPGACWALATEQTPQRIDCLSSNPKCAGLTTSDEVACWMAESAAAQHSYEASNNSYYGSALYSNQPNLPYSPAELRGLPLRNGMWQETWRSSEDPAWDYNAYTIYMVDRDGFFWRQDVYHEINQPNGLYVDAPEKTLNNENIFYACEFVTPSDLNSLCDRVGTAGDMYRTPAPDNDATADADIELVVQAQLDHLTANGALYGGNGTTADVTQWAGTSYPTKVWNYDEGAWVYTRVMVTAASGDLYTAQYSYYKSSPSRSDQLYIYRYSAAMVPRVCSRPFTGTYNQNSDIGTCSSLGYADFHP